MVALEAAHDVVVHLSELRAVALVEDHHHMLGIDGVRLVFLNEDRQFLYGGDDDMCIAVLQSPLQFTGIFGGVGSTFLEAVVLFHGLVVEVLAVDDEEHLVDTFSLAAQLCSLERGERLSATCGMPNIAASVSCAFLMKVGATLDTL